jgi:hypothetical protein
VPISKILSRKADDVPLQANDVLHFPDNKSGKLTATVIDRLVTFGGATASGLLVWGR